MELKYFRLIKTITEEGSIANSADKLFLTQSALSHQLKDLEQRLGFKVFYRKRNRWELTEEGRELYLLGNVLLERIEKGFATIERLRKGTVGSVKVSTECYSFYQGLPGFVQKMGLLYPGMDVALILEATHRPVAKVVSKEIDIAIVTKKPTDKTLSSVMVYEDELFALIHKENHLAGKAFLEARDFSKIHLIIHSYPLETVSVYEQFLKHHACTPQKVSAIPLTEVALEMVAANMGIMCMPKWALRSFKIASDLLFVPIGKSGLKRTHYVVFRSEDKHKKYLNDFISNFGETFAVKEAL
ncbi:LysR family transcriptional regulator [Maribacter sp. 2-571]|uniref:LysR family transcriptional regulator n=1 Tax=Maribacter sp. 2-571 TaxID=3417569 RepID=UPI003D354336